MYVFLLCRCKHLIKLLLSKLLRSPSEKLKAYSEIQLFYKHIYRYPQNRWSDNNESHFIIGPEYKFRGGKSYISYLKCLFCSILPYLRLHLRRCGIIFCCVFVFPDSKHFLVLIQNEICILTYGASQLRTVQDNPQRKVCSDAFVLR